MLFTFQVYPWGSVSHPGVRVRHVPRLWGPGAVSPEVGAVLAAAGGTGGDAAPSAGAGAAADPASVVDARAAIAAKRGAARRGATLVGLHGQQEGGGVAAAAGSLRDAHPRRPLVAPLGAVGAQHHHQQHHHHYDHDNHPSSAPLPADPQEPPLGPAAHHLRAVHLLVADAAAPPPARQGARAQAPLVNHAQVEFQLQRQQQRLPLESGGDHALQAQQE